MIFSLFGATSPAQVFYGSPNILYGLRKLNLNYNGSAIQVRRECDNATANIGFNTCGTLDTVTLKNFVFGGNPLSAINIPSEGAYSLRKLRCAYAGNAINVRRSCDNTTINIGFNSSGDLDTIALKSFTLGPMLSALSTSSAVAYSLRRLSCAYAGFAIQVRRSSDNATSNIGFTALGDLDTIALKTFVGANSGFVSIWYDQSGNNRNLSQSVSTNQPQIILTGTILRQNGRPTIKFNVGGNFSSLVFSGTVTTLSNPFSAILVGSVNNDNVGLFGWGANSGNGSRVNLCRISGNNSIEFQSLGLIGNSLPPGVLNIMSWTYTSGNISPGVSGFFNGSVFATTLFGANNSPAISGLGQIQVGSTPGAAGAGAMDGNISEAIAFSSALSNTDRRYIEWVQSDYYLITGPTTPSPYTAAAPSAFVTTWYDQSGNNRNTTQANTALQPVIINAGVLQKNASNRPSIFFNGGTTLRNSFVLNTQPVSTSCVWRARTLSGPGVELFGWGDNSGGGRRYGAWFEFISSTQGRYGVENQGAGTVGTNLLNTNTWYISSQILPSNSLPTLTQWVNGTSQAVTNIGAPATMNIPGGEFSISGVPTTLAHCHTGDIQEIIYFSSALSSTNRQYLEYGQSAYYGISGPPDPVTMPSVPPNAFVSVLYDQSGGLNLSTTGALTRQPQLMNLGRIIRLRSGSISPALQSSQALQTNLTGTFSPAYTGSTLTVNCVVTADVNSTSNNRIWSLGNSALTSSDWSDVNFGNINQRNSNEFVIERGGVSPSTVISITPSGSPLILSARFNGTQRQLFNNGTPSATAADNNAFNFNSIRLLQSINACCQASESFTGKMAENIQFSSSLSNTRRNLIESNQSAFYSITNPNTKYSPPAPGSYNYYVNGIGRESSSDSIVATRQSSGMGFTVGTAAGDFLKDNGDYLTCGINCPITATTSTSNLPPTVTQRWLNDWYVNKTDVNSNSGQVTVYFDFSEYGINLIPANPNNYVLLNRNSPSATFSIVSIVGSPQISGDRVLFTVDASNIPTNFYYTIGTTNTTQSPLPVKLASFNANCEDKYPILRWTTTSELNNDYFVLERSPNGSDFISVDTVDGAGNSNLTLSYQYRDIGNEGTNTYYRLLQKDIDGVSEYSNIISVNCARYPSQSLVTVYPNPGNTELVIEIVGEFSRELAFEMFDIQGKIVRSGTVLKQKVVATHSLVPGLYLIKLSNGETYKWVKDER